MYEYVLQGYAFKPISGTSGTNSYSYNSEYPPFFVNVIEAQEEEESEPDQPDNPDDITDSDADVTGEENESNSDGTEEEEEEMTPEELFEFVVGIIKKRVKNGLEIEQEQTKLIDIGHQIPKFGK